MRVAIYRSVGNLDSKIERILLKEGIKGDFITKFSRNTVNEYDCVVFTHKTNIPNLPKVLERIVLEKKIQVIYITNTLSISHFYNVLEDIYFNHIEEHLIDAILVKVIKNSHKYLREINILKDSYLKAIDELELLKLTNKAKLILIRKGFSEAESHKYIINKAMDLRISKKKLVNLIIKEKIDI